MLVRSAQQQTCHTSHILEQSQGEERTLPSLIQLVHKTSHSLNLRQLNERTPHTLELDQTHLTI